MAENNTPTAEPSKTCTACGSDKPLTNFPPDPRIKRDGRASRCHECARRYAAKRRAENGDYNRRWQRENAEHVNSSHRERREIRRLMDSLAKPLMFISIGPSLALTGESLPSLRIGEHRRAGLLATLAKLPPPPR